jgi:Phosphatase
MTRRPRSKRPPRLDAPQPIRPAGPSEPTLPTPRRRVVTGRIAGPHARMGRTEVAAVVARLAAGHPDATFGLELGRISREEAWAAIDEGWGYRGDDARACIEPERTLAGAARAAERLHEVARRGGRIALATGRPASLLGPYRTLAAALTEAGADVLAFEAFGPFGAGRSLWWIDGVAVVTDGSAILADDGVGAGPEWVFAVGRPEVVVADRGFAAAALGAGLETVVFADLDAAVFGVAARREHPVRLVPLDERRPPEAYAPIVAALASPRPHSTTPAPAAYADPTSGGEG